MKLTSPWWQPHFTTTQSPKSTSKQPLQQLFGSPWAAPWFATMPVTERRQGATTLRTERLTGPGDRQRQSDSHRGGAIWGSYCAALHWREPASGNVKSERNWELQDPGPQHPYHQSDFSRGWDRWGWCCAARRRPKPAMCKMWHLKEIGKVPWEEQMLGLNTDVTNILTIETKHSEGGVHLQHLGQCLQKKAICQSKLQRVFCQKTLEKQTCLSTSVSNSIIREVNHGDGGVDLQGFRHGLRTPPPASFWPKHDERRSRSRKNGGLDVCGAQTAAVKAELGGPAVFFQLLGEVLLRRHGTGAKEGKRSVGISYKKGFLSWFLVMFYCFMENETNNYQVFPNLKKCCVL